MSEKCNAPCVVNTAIGFHLVFCEKKHGHEGDHSLKMKCGEELLFGSKEATVSWNYIGVAVDGGVSGAPGLNERCKVSALIGRRVLKASTALRTVGSVKQGRCGWIAKKMRCLWRSALLQQSHAVRGSGAECWDSNTDTA